MAQDPDSIERDIERSRAQLAEAVDAIADRVSPRRVTARATSKAKAKLEWGVREANARIAQLAGGTGNRPAIGSGSSDPVTAPAPGERLGDLLGRANALLSTGTSQARKLVRRKDPAAVAAAVTAATVLALTLRRRRRHR